MTEPSAAPSRRRGGFWQRAIQFLRQIGDLVIWGNLPAGWVDVRGQPPAFQMAVRLGLWSAIGLACLLPFVGRTTDLAQRFGLFLENALSASMPLLAQYPLLVGGGLFLAGIVGWLRSHRCLPRWAFVFLCLGVWTFIYKLTQPLGMLSSWSFDTRDLTAVATLVPAGLYFFLLLRRRLTPIRLASLSIAALLLCFLEVYDLLPNPLALLESLPGGGTLFLVLSLLLGIAEMGDCFGVDRDSPDLPRRSRVFFYLGYVLLAILFAYWETLTHSGGYAEGYTATGFLLIGVPIALAALLSLPPDLKIRCNCSGQ